SAKRFAFLSRFAKNNMLRPASVVALMLGSLFSMQAQAVWNQVSGLTTIPAAVAIDPNNAGTGYAASSSGTFITLYRISSLNVGTPTAQQLTVSNMNLSRVSAIAVKPKQIFSDNDVILVAGDGVDLQTSYTVPKVYMLTGVAGSTTLNAIDISLNLAGQVGSISQIVMTKAGNAYLAHSIGIHSTSNITPTSQSANWTSVSNTVGKLGLIESATGVGNTLIAVVNQSAYGAAPGIYAAAESAGGQINFSPVTGLPTLDGQFSYIVSSAINSSVVSPGVYVSIANNGLYNCRLTSAAGAVTPTLGCTQSGVVGTSNVLTVMAVNSSGVLFGVDSTLNQLKNTTDGSFWNPNESTLPTGNILTDFFFVSGSTVLMGTDAGLYSSLTNVVPGTGSGTTNGTDVEVQSITTGGITQIQPSQQFNASVTIRNSGTQQIASVNLQMSVTNGSFGTVPQGCTGAGISVTCTGLTSINTAGLTQTLTFPVIANNANGQTAIVTASVQWVGGVDANTVNDSKSANVMISTNATGVGNVAGNRAPVLTGGNTQNIVINLSNKNATTGVLQATDLDVGDVVSFSKIKDATMGTFTLNGTTWSYKPNSTAKANTTDFVTLSMTDNKTTPVTVQLVFSFQGKSSSSGGALQPLFVLFAMLGMMFMRRKNWV
ncbi:MAG: hypothetical protein OEX19_13630, partial [Gammaproteobacteria bacterium]|nr:hypothetical protein [Gammaproteobacteria bacterium]